MLNDVGLVKWDKKQNNIQFDFCILYCHENVHIYINQKGVSMTVFKPILCEEFGAEWSTMGEFAYKLKEMGLEATKNLLDDPYLYYSHKYPELDTSQCRKEMFIAQCMMNEFFEGKEIDLLKIETIIEGDFDVDEGNGNGNLWVVGIRVYYRLIEDKKNR